MSCSRYNGKSNDSLTRLRYVQWNQATATNDQLNPEKLPPTERATYFHSLRVHLEVSRAMNLDIKCLNPKNWGWNRVNNVLVPIRCDLPAAPESLLNVIRCKCKTASRNTCGTMLCTCRKNGLKCVPACGDCRGLSCNNPQVETPTFNQLEDDDFNNIFDILGSF